MSTPILGGKVSGAEQNAVVLLAAWTRKDGVYAECTATLVSPHVLVTARHCVSESDSKVLCSPNGQPVEGGLVRGDFPASELYVFVGEERPTLAGDLSQTARARGSRIVHSNSETLCDNDFALVVLDRPISGARAPLRFDSPSAGDRITGVGWGATETTLEPEQRQQRPDAPIEFIGPYEDPTTLRESIGQAEFRVGEISCYGDSGGPALTASSGALVGVLSRGGNGLDGDPNVPSSRCVGGVSVYTKLAAFRALVESTLRAAGDEPWLEGEPDPEKKALGQGCSDDASCRSGICSLGTCAQGCEREACAETMVCSEVSGRKVCAPPAVDPGRSPAPSPPREGSCATVSGRDDAPPIGCGAFVLGLVLLEARRASRGGATSAKKTRPTQGRTRLWGWSRGGSNP